MASLRNGKQRKDGTRYVQVLYRMDGKQTSTSFQDLASATRFKELVEKFGPEQALSTLGTDPDMTSVTVREWIEHHIEHLQGRRLLLDEDNQAVVAMVHSLTSKSSPLSRSMSSTSDLRNTSQPFICLGSD